MSYEWRKDMKNNWLNPARGEMGYYHRVKPIDDQPFS